MALRFYIRLYLRVAAFCYIAGLLLPPFTVEFKLVVEPALSLLAAAVITPFVARAMLRSEGGIDQIARRIGEGDDAVTDATVRIGTGSTDWGGWKSYRMTATRTGLLFASRITKSQELAVKFADISRAHTRGVNTLEAMSVNPACTILVLSLRDGGRIEAGLHPPIADVLFKLINQTAASA